MPTFPHGLRCSDWGNPGLRGTTSWLREVRCQAKTGGTSRPKAAERQSPGFVVVLVLFGGRPGTCHNPQSRAEEGSRAPRQLLDEPHMFSHERTVKTSLFARVYFCYFQPSLALCFGSSLILRAHLPSPLSHHCAWVITRFCQRDARPALRLDDAPVNSRAGGANQEAVVMVTRS